MRKSSILIWPQIELIFVLLQEMSIILYLNNLLILYLLFCFCNISFKYSQVVDM